jgi:hypothetical protein
MSNADQPQRPRDDAAAASAVDAAEGLESMSDDQLMKMLEESRIIIKKGGEVIIENLTPGLLEVAFELNPDQPSIQCRVEASRPQGDDDAEPREEAAAQGEAAEGERDA